MIKNNESKIQCFSGILAINDVVVFEAETNEGESVLLTVIDLDAFVSAAKNEQIVWLNKAGNYVIGTKADLSNLKILTG